jgi:hypothetical protein
VIGTDRWRSEPPCVYPPAKAGHMAKRRVGVQYSPSMLEPVRPGAVSSNRALCLQCLPRPLVTLCLSIRLLSLSLSLSLCLSLSFSLFLFLIVNKLFSLSLGPHGQMESGGRVLAVNAGARAPRGGVTRHGVVRTDLQSLCDCQ